MYRKNLKCENLVVDDDGYEARCGEEVGYALVSHDFDQVLVEARRRCRACGAVGMNEAALLWQIMPAASEYRGPTLQQMALSELERLRVRAA